MKDVKKRRCQDLLMLSGLGVIAFGVWSVLKTILLFIFRDDLLAEVPDDTFSRVFVFVFIGLILLIDFSARLFVGLSARAEGSGKKKGYAYIVFAVLIALASLTSLVLVFFDAGTTSLLELVVSVIVEVTSIVVVFEMLAAAFAVKKLRKEEGEAK